MNTGKFLIFGCIAALLAGFSYAAIAQTSWEKDPGNPVLVPSAAAAWDDQFAAAGPVRLSVYDYKGRLVRTLVDEPRNPGRYTEIWRGRDQTGAAVASGVYLIRLESQELVRTQKAVLSK